jgi:hypothetical protein
LLAIGDQKRSWPGRFFSFWLPLINKCSVRIEKFSVFSTGTNHSTSHFPFELAR